MKRLVLDGGCSSVERFLESFSSERALSSSRGRREPRASFAISKSRVLAKYTSHIEALEILKTPSVVSDLPDLSLLIGSFESLLYAQMEFLDDCKVIASKFYSEETGRRGYERYRRFIADYRRHLSCLVNGIKHEQARLRSVWIYDERSGVPGYYLEQVYDDDAVGPNRKIHDGGCTASSFLWEVRLHFHAMFYAADCLSRAGHWVYGESNSHEASVDRRKDELALKLAYRIQKFPNICYPNEQWKTGASVSLADKKADPCIIVAPSQGYRSIQMRGIKVGLEGDGSTRQFQLPYMGENWLALQNRNLTRPSN